MSKLRCLQPVLRVLPPQLTEARGDEQRVRGSALQVIRARILSRDAGICQCARCKREGAVREATIVDHRQPIWAGGRETDDNRQSINSECHDMKSAHETRCRLRGGWVPWDGTVGRGGEILTGNGSRNSTPSHARN